MKNNVGFIDIYVTLLLFISYNGLWLLPIAHAQTADTPSDSESLQNAVYLYLRLAGVVWIVVEWIAAIVLIHAFYWLRTQARERQVL